MHGLTQIPVTEQTMAEKDEAYHNRNGQAVCLLQLRGVGVWGVEICAAEKKRR